MFLFFDKEIITIVLDNLISNAIKYTEQGRVTLSLYQTMRNEVAYTEIKVSDTGYGISAEALPHIFDRYYQESGKHQASGTGIGLALVKNLVTLHEGEIRAESMQNEGSTFYISLLTDNIYPNALHADSTEPIQEDTNQEASLEYPQETTLDTGKPILLIVEDNEEIQKYIAESFADSFEVLPPIERDSISYSDCTRTIPRHYENQTYGYISSLLPDTSLVPARKFPHIASSYFLL